MEVGIMITNNGPHSAEKWAETTSSHIVTIADSLVGEKRGAAIKLQAAVYDVLVGHHTTVQEGERNKIKEFGVARLQHDMTPDDHVKVDDVLADIIAAAKGTPWESDFQKPEFAERLHQLLVDHFMSNAFIERSWHSDRNINTPEGQAFRKQFHQGE
jgi:hypothetical protein